MVWWNLRCSFGGFGFNTVKRWRIMQVPPPWAPSPPWLSVAAAAPRPSEVEAVHGPTGNVPPGAPDTWTMVSKDWETLMMIWWWIIIVVIVIVIVIIIIIIIHNAAGGGHAENSCMSFWHFEQGGGFHIERVKTKVRTTPMASSGAPAVHKARSQHRLLSL